MVFKNPGTAYQTRAEIDARMRRTICGYDGPVVMPGNHHWAVRERNVRGLVEARLRQGRTPELSVIVMPPTVPQRNGCNLPIAEFDRERGLFDQNQIRPLLKSHSFYIELQQQGAVLFYIDGDGTVKRGYIDDGWALLPPKTALAYKTLCSEHVPFDNVVGDFVFERANGLKRSRVQLIGRAAGQSFSNPFLIDYYYPLFSIKSWTQFPGRFHAEIRGIASIREITATYAKQAEQSLRIYTLYGEIAFGKDFEMKWGLHPNANSGWPRYFEINDLSRLRRDRYVFELGRDGSLSIA